MKKFSNYCHNEAFWVEYSAGSTMERRENANEARLGLCGGEGWAKVRIPVSEQWFEPLTGTKGSIALAF